MAHSVGKDDKGRYWFRSRQRLVDITNAEEFYVKRYPLLRYLFFKSEWRVYSKTLVKKGFYDYPYIKQGWNPPRYRHECLGIYKTEDEAATALECLMHMREIELIVF